MLPSECAGYGKGNTMTVITSDMIFNTVTINPTTIFSKMKDSDFLRKAMLAVENNNQINDGKWSDWSSSYHIAETYELENDDENEVHYLQLILDINKALEAE